MNDPRQNISPPKLIASLRRFNLLPAIVFVPTRRGCDEAAAEVSFDRSQPQDPERQEIRQRMFNEYAAENPEIRGHKHRKILINSGVAAHHAAVRVHPQGGRHRLAAAGGARQRRQADLALPRHGAVHHPRGAVAARPPGGERGTRPRRGLRRRPHAPLAAALRRGRGLLVASRGKEQDQQSALHADRYPGPPRAPSSCTSPTTKSLAASWGRAGCSSTA